MSVMWYGWSQELVTRVGHITGMNGRRNFVLSTKIFLVTYITCVFVYGCTAINVSLLNVSTCGMSQNDKSVLLSMTTQPITQEAFDRAQPMFLDSVQSTLNRRTDHQVHTRLHGVYHNTTTNTFV